LLNHHKSTFYLRILVSTFLRVKMSIAKSILETLIDKTNDEFINILKDYHTQYRKKDTSYKEVLHNHIGHMKRYFNSFTPSINFSSVKSYLDFGCSDGVKSLAIGQILNIEEENIYGIDIKNESNFVNFFEYDGINIPDNLKVKKFDMVTCLQVLHHVDSAYLQNILIDLVSMISDHGFLILRDHDCFSNWMKILVDLQHLFYSIDTEHIMPVKLYKSKNEWKEIFSDLGLTLVSEFAENNDPTGGFFMVFQKK